MGDFLEVHQKLVPPLATKPRVHAAERWQTLPDEPGRRARSGLFAASLL